MDFKSTVTALEDALGCKLFPCSGPLDPRRNLATEGHQTPGGRPYHVVVHFRDLDGQDIQDDSEVSCWVQFWWEPPGVENAQYGYPSKLIPEKIREAVQDFEVLREFWKALPVELEVRYQRDRERILALYPAGSTDPQEIRNRPIALNIVESSRKSR